ncbi:hypothetical protein E2C01_039847 [Portunus trituberculatus]|uniref:Uncharacterized protein n=1 Tax=Portunus trituberculatus TaxID=210409 RepID=A0A5B7FMC4_PORTR|nr:hypothetical protein [Portunus trituberculatus]
MRFSRGEVVFHRLKIRPKTANVTEVNEEIVEGGVKTFWVATERAVRSFGYFWSLPRKGLQCMLYPVFLNHYISNCHVERRWWCPQDIMVLI